MNEAETRAERIDPKLKACGWGVVEGSKVLREYNITAGKIQTGGGRGKREIADYVLVYKGIKLAVVEAKSDELEVGEGVMQAKKYAEKLKLETTYSTNGKAIYQICMKSGEEGLVTNFLSPDELWNKTFAEQNDWREKFANVPFEDKSGSWQLRYYQEIAVQRTVEAIAQRQRKNFAHPCHRNRKNGNRFSNSVETVSNPLELKTRRQPQTKNFIFSRQKHLSRPGLQLLFCISRRCFGANKPNEIKKSGKVPTNGSIFFTIFQTFMTSSPEGAKSNSEAVSPLAENQQFNFGQYPPDYFDFIIIDECHRGGANDESNWRSILEYFSPAVQLGLTATPKRKDNVDTYKYFGEPVYIYSLKEGINDGFLTPFKVKRIKTTLDDYRYTSDDTIVEGEIEEGKLYEEKDFNRTIEIVEREAKRVNIFLDEANQNEKAIIFCANQGHAALIRDLVNQDAKSKDPFYCVRVTANDGEEGERLLREFQDNEKTIPTILTTSQKLSTGVDARNIRNIVLLRPVNSMIEFKQIVGRGTRLFDGKEFFTIYDFVDAYKHFSDPEWDGEPIGEEPKEPKPYPTPEPTDPPIITDPGEPTPKKPKIKIKLRNGKEREIKHMVSTSFWSADGKPISAEEFLNNLFGELPKLFKDEEELRKLWSNPMTEKYYLENLDAAGFPKDDLLTLQKLVDMEKATCMMCWNMFSMATISQ
jgi:type I restriction enzyme, R subunit